jgi:hypothetical protein
MKGGETGIDQLQLEVRVGWFNRTEVVPLYEGWYVIGTAKTACSGSAPS